MIKEINLGNDWRIMGESQYRKNQVNGAELIESER